MIKFLEYNIKDPNIIGLIKKYLKAGIMDKGKYVATEEGSAQGNIISPVLANIYMHFVLVLWYKEIVQKRANIGKTASSVEGAVFFYVSRGSGEAPSYSVDLR